MDPQVQAAYILAAGAVVAAIVGGVIAIWLRRRKKPAPDRPPETKIQEIAVSYSVDKCEITSTFDDNGSGQNERKWTRIRATQTIQNLKVPYALKLVSPNGKVFPPEVDTLADTDFPVTFETEEVTDASVKGSIVLLGVISPTSGQAGYRLTQRFEHAFCVTRKEAQEAYQAHDWKTEYASASIICPTRNLRVTVNFPPSFRGKNVQASAVAFEGLTERVHAGETARVSTCVTREEDRAILVVSDPVFGFRYALSWWPPE